MQCTSVSRWLRIVSIRIAVLPVERSPMISSRWPRPTFVIASMALIPVWSGSLTGWRATPPGAPRRLALADLLPLAEQRRPDVVLLEVEGQPDDAVLQLEHLHRHRVLQPVDAGDAVADLQDGADLGEVGLDVVLLDPLPEDRGDLFRSQLHALAPSR